MGHYQLDDPRLQEELDRLAAEAAATWPTPDDAQLAQLARILPTQTSTPEPRRIPPRRAA